MKGAVVLVPFPFTDFSATKLRPALVLHAIMMRLTAGPMRENAGGIFIRNAYDVVVAFISSKVTAPTSRADILLLQEDSGFAASG